MVTGPTWTAARTKVSGTKKFCNHQPYPSLILPLKTPCWKLWGVQDLGDTSHPAPCIALQFIFLCSQLWSFSVFGPTVYPAHQLVLGNSYREKLSHFSKLLYHTDRKFSKDCSQRIFCEPVLWYSVAKTPNWDHGGVWYPTSWKETWGVPAYY